jgi:hypothetical protein
MAAKLLSLYLLAIACLKVVRTGVSAGWRQIRPVRSFADSVDEIAPLILDQRDEVNLNGTNAGTGSAGQCLEFPGNPG